jgi:LPXTG-motif cell wall-anchored protein
VVNGQVSTFTAQAVPEPSSLALAFGGLLAGAGLALRRRRRNARTAA